MPAWPSQTSASDASALAPSRWLLVVSFASGAAGLVYETVWFHRGALVFGNSIWSTSLVLSSFMAGLALGGAAVATKGARVQRLLRTYAALELAVALSGVTLTYALPALTDLIVALSRSAAGSLWLTNVIRFITAFAVLLVPSTAMGATLPLLVAALAGRRMAFGSALGSVYGWNTLGAVAGVLATEVWLIGMFGVAGSAWCAAILGVAAAAMALRLEAGLAARLPARAGRPTQASELAASRRSAVSPMPARASLLLVASFLSGLTLLALEVVWFRFLTMYVLSTTLAASLMLAVVLASIGVGGLLSSAWLKWTDRAPQYLVVIGCAAGCAVVASYAGFRILTEGAQVAAWHRVLWFACALTLPTSVLSGMLFTLLGAALQRDGTAPTRTAGWLTLVNTMGGACGPLLAAFLMLPSLGMEGTFFALAALYLVIGAVALAVEAMTGGVRWPVAAVALLALAVALVRFPFGLMSDVYFQRVVQPYAGDGSTIVATREGPSETILLMQQTWLAQPVYTRLVTNGFSMSGTAVPALRYMRYFVYWPMVLHKGPIKRVLVVCYGVGVTAGAAVDLPTAESIDVAEISPDVVAMSDIIYPSRHPLRDPRVRLHLEDGRQLLQTTSERFDLITGEPPPPRTPGAENIYTREYFQLIHDRLAEGGMTTYWLPVGRPDPGTNVTAIIRAFCNVFSDCSLWNATPFDLMLAGSRGDTRQVSEAEFMKSWQVPELRSRLAEIGLEVPLQIGATFLGDATYLAQLTGDTPPLDDNHPQRLHPVRGRPSLSDPGYGVDPAVTKFYETVMDPMRARQAFATSAFIRSLWPETLIAQTLPYFDHQSVLNTVLWEGGRPLRRIESLHRLLSDTPLRTLPLWILGSDDVKQRIAKQATTDTSGTAEYAEGLTAIVARDYARAASSLADSERRGLRGDALRPLQVYALCQAGNLNAARQAARGAVAQGNEEKHFWEWMGATCQVGPYGGG